MRQGERAARTPAGFPRVPPPPAEADAVCDTRLLEAVSQKHLLKSRPSVLLAARQAEGISRGMHTETSFRPGRPALTRGLQGVQKPGRPEPPAPIPGSQPRSRVQAPGRAGPTACANASLSDQGGCWPVSERPVRENDGFRGTRVPSACSWTARTRAVRGDLE